MSTVSDETSCSEQQQSTAESEAPEGGVAMQDSVQRGGTGQAGQSGERPTTPRKGDTAQGLSRSRRRRVSSSAEPPAIAYVTSWMELETKLAGARDEECVSDVRE